VAEAPRDRRAERHAATKREIVTAAWALARERGLAGWALRDVAAAVGMRAPSLYVYFDSKNALYDAMFADGWRQLLERYDSLTADAREAPPADLLRRGAAVHFEFCVEEPARFQLLFLRPIPGFEPSAETYAVAREALERGATVLAAAGAGEAAQVDLWTALLTGLASQQISNDPGGDRWQRLVEPAVDMFLAAQQPG
jgi:AcrR family transcriptional regulator